MYIIGLIIAFCGIILFEAPKLIKDKMWGELIAFSGLLLFGMVFSFAAVLNIKMPNPTALTDIMFGPPSKLLISIIKSL